METTLETMMSYRMHLTRISDTVSLESNSETENSENSDWSDSETEESLEESDNEPKRPNLKSKYSPPLIWKEHYLRDHSYITYSLAGG